MAGHGKPVARKSPSAIIVTGDDAREELERRKRTRAQMIMRKSSVRRPPNYKTVENNVMEAFDNLDEAALELLRHGVSAQELAERIELLASKKVSAGTE